jgi:hypothetical protein
MAIKHIYECGVRYRVFAGKEGRISTKEKLFTGSTMEIAKKKRTTFCKNLENSNNFYEFVSYYN